MSFTYMAKSHDEFVGNSLNIKLTFYDQNQKNIYGETLNNLTAGILSNILDYTIFYCPNANSYKRLKEEDIDINWNKVGDNENLRGINIIKEKSESKVLFTLTGSDTNPYLALMSILNSALNGLLSKDTIEKAEKKLHDKKLPLTLYNSIQNYEKSNEALNSLGEKFHKHFNSFYTWEYTQYMNQVSNWELERYLYSV